MIKINLKQESEFSPLLFCHSDVLRQLHILGMAMMTMSLLYLMAANWWMLPQLIRLAIPMLVLLGSAVAATYYADSPGLRQTLDAISALMLGLALAVIGQIYQTGADSYLLFLVWSILLLPWLYRQNVAVFVMLTVVSQLALYCYFKQSFWLERAEGGYVVALNFLAASSFIYAMRHYAVLRYAFIVFFMAISIGSMLAYIGHQHPIDLASVCVLPLAAAFYFYRQQRVMESTLLIAGIALSLSIWLMEQAGEYLTNSAGGLFLLAVFIFAWFAVISFVLTRLFPRSALSMIPLAIGAWIAGIILAILLLTFWQTVSVVLGMVFIGIAWGLLYKQRSFFIRQFAYCLWVCGQIAVLVHVELLTDNVWLVWFIQLVLLCCSVFTRQHWLIVTLQLITSHILAIVALFWTDSFVHHTWLFSIVLGGNSILFILMLLMTRIWQNSVYMKSVVLWALFTLLGIAVGQMLLGFQVPSILQARMGEIMILYVLPCLFVLCLVVQNLPAFQKTVHHIWLWLIPFLALLLIYFGYFEVFVLWLFLAWATVYRHRWVQSLCILLLIFWLWILYYRLGISFLSKSLTILISGFMVVLLVRALRPIARQKPIIEGDQV